MENFFELMKNRNLVSLINDEEGLTNLLKKSNFNEKGERYAIYCGFDPTAPSLHNGHLVPLTALRRAQNAGLQPIILFGGATGLIGDPTGRTEMRPMYTAEQINEFVEKYKQQVTRFFKTDVENPPIFVNNYDWISKLSWIDFARNVGIHFTVCRLLSAEVNKTRLEHGLTFMEMGYQLLQSYDFMHLFKNYNCVLQIGGNDQWSNILGGTELIRKSLHADAYCLTQPLITDSSGKKIGKSTGNSTWLDPNMTSPYEFYQFFRNVDDVLLKEYFRMYTFIDMDEVSTIINENINKAKEHLALTVTAFVHGEHEAHKALQAAHALFSGEGDLSAAPVTYINREQLGSDAITLLQQCAIFTSKGEARRLFQAGGVMFNGEKMTDSNIKITEELFNHSSGGLLVRKGKKDYHIIKIK